MIAKKDLITFRDYSPKDKNFILVTWLRGLWEDNDFFHSIRKRTFYDHYEPVLKRLLENETTRIHICCLKDGEDVILGYAALSPMDQMLHWVYVKHLWRRIGIGRDLLAPFKIKFITHTSKLTDEFRPKRFHFNPFGG